MVCGVMALFVGYYAWCWYEDSKAAKIEMDNTVNELAAKFKELGINLSQASSVFAEALSDSAFWLAREPERDLDGEAREKELEQELEPEQEQEEEPLEVMSEVDKILDEAKNRSV